MSHFQDKFKDIDFNKVYQMPSRSELINALARKYHVRRLVSHRRGGAYSGGAYSGGAYSGGAYSGGAYSGGNFSGGGIRRRLHSRGGDFLSKSGGRRRVHRRGGGFWSKLWSGIKKVGSVGARFIPYVGPAIGAYNALKSLKGSARHRSVSHYHRRGSRTGGFSLMRSYGIARRGRGGAYSGGAYSGGAYSGGDHSLMAYRRRMRRQRGGGLVASLMKKLAARSRYRKNAGARRRVHHRRGGIVLPRGYGAFASSPAQIYRALSRHGRGRSGGADINKELQVFMQRGRAGPRQVISRLQRMHGLGRRRVHRRRGGVMQLGCARRRRVHRRGGGLNVGQFGARKYMPTPGVTHGYSARSGVGRYHRRGGSFWGKLWRGIRGVGSVVGKVLPYVGPAVGAFKALQSLRGKGRRHLRHRRVGGRNIPNVTPEIRRRMAENIAKYHRDVANGMPIKVYPITDPSYVKRRAPVVNNLHLGSARHRSVSNRHRRGGAYSGGAYSGGAYSGGKRPMNAWIRHLMAFHRKHPHMTYGQAMKAARASYRR